MKVLIVYDSHYGNTAQIAKAVASGMSPEDEVRTITSADLDPDDLPATDLFIVGSPTIAWRISSPVKELLARIPEPKFHGVAAAAFDTGFQSRLSGSAAKGIDRRLRRNGCVMVGSPTRFFVTGLEGPLKDGELERATEWGRTIRANRNEVMWNKVA